MAGQCARSLGKEQARESKIGDQRREIDVLSLVFRPWSLGFFHENWRSA
jgi:hypothetical protein